MIVHSSALFSLNSWSEKEWVSTNFLTLDMLTTPVSQTTDRAVLERLCIPYDCYCHARPICIEEGHSNHFILKNLIQTCMRLLASTNITYEKHSFIANVLNRSLLLVYGIVNFRTHMDKTYLRRRVFEIVSQFNCILWCHQFFR